MKQQWLNFILHLSGIIYKKKSKILNAGVIKTVALFLELVVLELFIGVISLPLYFFITRSELEEKYGMNSHEMKIYILRRKLTLAAVGIFLLTLLIKTLLVFCGIISLSIPCTANNSSQQAEEQFTEQALQIGETQTAEETQPMPEAVNTEEIPLTQQAQTVEGQPTEQTQSAEGIQFIQPNESGEKKQSTQSKLLQQTQPGPQTGSTEQAQSMNQSQSPGETGSASQGQATQQTESSQQVPLDQQPMALIQQPAFSQQVETAPQSQGIRSGKEASVSLPLTSSIPNSYIPDFSEKIKVYQKLSSTSTLTSLNAIKDALVAQYGPMPDEAVNFLRVIELKIVAQNSGVLSITTQQNGQVIVLTLSSQVTPQNITNLLSYNAKWTVNSDNSLTINVQDLGSNWLNGLEGSMNHLD